jgi:hypothetical protein
VASLAVGGCFFDSDRALITPPLVTVCRQAVMSKCEVGLLAQLLDQKNISVIAYRERDLVDATLT